MPLLKTLMDQGRAALARGDRQLALQCFTQIVERDPRNVAALNNCGLLLGHLGQIEPALGCFRQSLQIDPDNVIALVNGGIALTHLGQAATAIDWYARALAIDTRHVEAWKCRGQALRLLKRPAEAAECLRFPNGISKNRGRGGRLPYAFTEHGVVMLCSVLKSERAVQMNVLIVRAFVRLREMLATHKDLARKIEDVERQQKEHGQQLAAVCSVVRRLIVPPRKRKRPIGFRTMP